MSFAATHVESRSDPLTGSIVPEWGTRAFVLSSTFAAAVWELDLASRDWPPSLRIGAVLFVVASLAAVRWRRIVVPWLFAAGYVAPILLLAAAGRFRAPFLDVWLLAMLGAMTVTSHDGGWSFPRRWKAALVLWAMAVALSWPIIVLRESDFYLPLFFESIPLNGGGNTPANAAAWTINVALTHLVGLLWFDWLCRHYAIVDRNSFTRDVVRPLAVVALAAAGVGVLQGLVDVTWLSGGQWAAINRAGGSLVDGNPSGMLMAVWSTLFLTFLFAPSRTMKAVGVVGAVATWTAAAASGSRTAILAAAIGLGIFLVRVVPLARRRRLPWRPIAVGGLALVAAVALVASMLKTNGVVSRVRTVLPSIDRASIAYFLRYQFWDRNGPYGTAAVHMLRDSPIVGVGVGAFHTLVPDYSYPINKFNVRSDPDNSQNWYRHQLAELGIAGSIGWIAWAVLIIPLLWRSAPTSGDAPLEGAVRGALVALSLVSLIAMPTQNIVVALTFWTIAFWWIVLGAPRVLELTNAATLSRGTWLRISVVAVVFVAVTLYEALHGLRPPMRAVTFDWHYTYGFYDVEHDADGKPFRWAQARAVDVVSATMPWLKLTAWVNHPDVSIKPVTIKVWCGDDLVIDRVVTSNRPLTASVHVPDGQKRVAIRTWTSRAVRPVDYGVPDERELGLMLRTEFSPSPIIASAR